VTIQEYGSIGEIVGAIATVATLIYLALQIRANTLATKADTRRTNQNNRQLAYSDIIASEEVASIFKAGLADRSGLSSTERIRFNFLFSKVVADSANAFADQRDGLESAEMADITLSSILPHSSVAGWSRVLVPIQVWFYLRVSSQGRYALSKSRSQVNNPPPNILPKYTISI
jgi:hypothetical protein